MSGVGGAAGAVVSYGQRDVGLDRDEMRNSRLRRVLGGSLHRELLVLRQTWGDDRIDEDRVEVPSVADPGSQSPQRLGRARLLSHLTRLIRTTPVSANLAVADLPHVLVRCQ